MKKFAQRLDALRRADETKKEFAKRIGVSPVQLSRYYSGADPGWKVLKRITDRTGASVDWLTSAAEEPAEAEPARRIGARRHRALQDQDLVSIAASYIDDLQRLDRESRDAIKDLLQELTAKPEYLTPVSAYLGFLKFEAVKKKKKPLKET